MNNSRAFRFLSPEEYAILTLEEKLAYIQEAIRATKTTPVADPPAAPDTSVNDAEPKPLARRK